MWLDPFYGKTGFQFSPTFENFRKTRKTGRQEIGVKVKKNSKIVKKVQKTRPQKTDRELFLVFFDPTSKMLISFSRCSYTSLRANFFLTNFFAKSSYVLPSGNFCSKFYFIPVKLRWSKNYFSNYGRSCAFFTFWKFHNILNPRNSTQKFYFIAIKFRKLYQKISNDDSKCAHFNLGESHYPPKSGIFGVKNLTL